MDRLSIIANIAQIFSVVWTLAFGSYALHEVLSNAGPLQTWFSKLNLPKINIFNFFSITVVILLVTILTRIMALNPFDDLLHVHYGGVDLESYCNSLHYYSENVDYKSCYSEISLDDACNWQYGTTGLHFHLKDPSNPKTGDCLDPQKGSIGGISGMSDYCKAKYKTGGTSEGTLMGKTWVCQMDINMTIACIWQYGILNIEAREDHNWECYKN